MMTLKKLVLAIWSYYTDYLADHSLSTRWLGGGARALLLYGAIQKSVFHNLWFGFSPDRTQALVQNAGSDKRQPGIDTPCQAPSTVSVCLATPLRAPVIQCQQSSIDAVVGLLQAETGYTRRGKGGTEREPAAIVVAAFDQYASRSLDPHLHTHLVTINLGLREDGTWGSLCNEELYRWKMTLGAAYRVQLAYELQQRLGLTIVREKNWFEIAEIPRSIAEHFSKRSRQIQETLADWGGHSAQAAALAALVDRPTKNEPPLEELVERWEREAIALGLDIDALVQKSKLGPQPQRPTEEIQAEVIGEALEVLTHDQSHFSRRDLIRRACEAAQGSGLSLDQTLAAVNQTLRQSPDILCVGSLANEARYTTREVAREEANMLALVEAGRNDARHLVAEVVITDVLKSRPTITSEQEAALRHLTTNVGNVAAVEGWAGTGKTFTLEAAHAAWSHQYRVVGMALSGKAAEGLEAGTGIPSTTIAETLRAWDTSATEPVLQTGKAAVKAGQKRATPSAHSIPLDAKTIVVVDEAAMVGTKQLNEIIERVTAANAKLVLVGDSRQLQAIERGGGFQAIGDRVGKAELQEITRQRAAWAREAVKRIALGRSEEGLGAFRECGFVSVTDDRRQAMKAMIHDWSRDGLSDPQHHVMLAARNAETAALNQAAQAERRQAGLLGTAATVINEERIFSGDRVVFGKNSRRYGVRNGDCGTVYDMSPLKGTVDVLLDKGRMVRINVTAYDDVKLGYAVTTHKAQGMTVDGRVYVLLGGQMQDREMSYVQLSRCRNDTFLYVDRFEAGPELENLERQMRTSNQKLLALAVDLERSQQLRQELRLTP